MISAYIVVRNEEKNIERCIKSFIDVVDELIIVDGSSTDNTVEICKKYTDKIYIKPPQECHDADRPFAISKANGEWILCLDADETLSKELHDNIRNLVNQSAYVAYHINRRLYYSKDLNTFFKWKDYQTRLFRKDSILELGKAHTGVQILNGKTKNIDCILNHFVPEYFSYSTFKNHHLKALKVYADQSNKTMPSIFYYFKGVIALFFYFFKYFLYLGWYKDGWIGLKASVYIGGLSFFYINYYIAINKDRS